MATHLLGPGLWASLVTGLLLHGPPPPDVALERCLLLPEACVSAGVCDGEDRGQDSGPGAIFPCSKALRAMNRWCCRLLLLCLFRTTSLVFRLVRDGH